MHLYQSVHLLKENIHLEQFQPILIGNVKIKKVIGLCLSLWGSLFPQLSSAKALWSFQSLVVWQCKGWRMYQVEMC